MLKRQSAKVKKLKRLKKIVERLKKRGRKIVFTNGCFDILHTGHLKYLEAAKKKGAILIVGLNSDASVKRIKGETRPLNAENERAYILSGLACVDFVIIFNEDTPYRLISALTPDVLVKGSDWNKDKIVGRDILKSYGGKVTVIPYIKGFSTTAIIKKIAKQNKQ